MVAISVGPSVAIAESPDDLARSIVGCEAAKSLCDGQLARLLSSKDEKAAVRAALALGRTGLRDAEGPLAVAAANDRRAPVQAMAVYSLGLLQSPKLFDYAQHLRNERSGAVRVADLDAVERYETTFKMGARLFAATAPERHIHDGIVATIVATMLHDADPLVRGRAAPALAPFADGPQGRTAARGLVEAMRTERNDDVRAAIMWTVFRKYALQVPRQMLTAGLHDHNELVRIEAVRAYGRLKNADALPALLPSLHDPSWRVAEQAAESVKALRKQSPTEHLTAIAPEITLPAIPADPFADLKALPRSSPAGGAPDAAHIDARLALDPHTAADMLGPVHGPHPRIRLVTTKGNVYVVLFPEWAPLTVENFLNLSDRGFFDDNQWFRIVPDFVVQTGEKDAKNAPGPGYSIPAELNPLEQVSYIISMGLDYDEKTATPKIDSAGSEYYITLSPQLHLNLPFTVFGRVEWGQQVLANLIESDRVVRIERLPDVNL